MNKLIKCDECQEEFEKQEIRNRSMTTGTILDLCKDCVYEFDFATRAGIDERL
jgi:hypothetical protein